MKQIHIVFLVFEQFFLKILVKKKHFSIFFNMLYIRDLENIFFLSKITGGIDEEYQIY